MDRHGAGCSWRRVAHRRVGLAPADRCGVGDFDRRLCVGLFIDSPRKVSSSRVLARPLSWVALEFVRAHLPEISFPWNLLGYPAAANLGVVQFTTVTGIYGLSFLVAGFNALLAWSDAGPASTAKRRLGVLAAASTCIIAVDPGPRPRLVPRPQANHAARAVQLNFPEDAGVPLELVRDPREPSCRK